MVVRIATAPDSWGVWFPSDVRQIGWRQFLDEVVAAGYEAIELGPFGYLPTNARTLRSELRSRRLQLTGGTMGASFSDRRALREILRDAARICRFLGSLDAHYLVLLPDMYTDLFTGKVVGPTELDDQSWQQMLDVLEHVGAIARDNGIAAVFHPHAQSVVETEIQINRLLDGTDPEVLGLCLDLGHHAYSGGQPVRFLRDHAPRIPYLHFKNVDRSILEHVVQEDLPFARAVELGAMCTLERGTIDYAEVRDVLAATGFHGWAVVEQDIYPASEGVPFAFAHENRSFLRRTGIG